MSDLYNHTVSLAVKSDAHFIKCQFKGFVAELRRILFARLFGRGYGFCHVSYTGSRGAHLVACPRMLIRSVMDNLRDGVI